LNAPSTSLNAEVVVRTVKVSYRASYPDLVEYAIAFANDWADDLAIKTSATVPSMPGCRRRLLLLCWPISPASR